MSSGLMHSPISCHTATISLSLSGHFVLLANFKWIRYIETLHFRAREIDEYEGIPAKNKYGEKIAPHIHSIYRHIGFDALFFQSS